MIAGGVGTEGRLELVVGVPGLGRLGSPRGDFLVASAAVLPP